MTAAGTPAPRCPGFGDPVRSRPRSARPPSRRALPPSPAARHAPLTRRPAARRRRAPRTPSPGRPPRRPADKARTAARAPRPEVSPRPLPGNFRRRSRRTRAGRSLGGLDFRPGERWAAGGRGAAVGRSLVPGAERIFNLCAPEALSVACSPA